MTWYMPFIVWIVVYVILHLFISRNVECLRAMFPKSVNGRIAAFVFIHWLISISIYIMADVLENPLGGHGVLGLIALFIVMPVYARLTYVILSKAVLGKGQTMMYFMAGVPSAVVGAIFVGIAANIYAFHFPSVLHALLNNTIGFNGKQIVFRLCYGLSFGLGPAILPFSLYMIPQLRKYVSASLVFILFCIAANQSWAYGDYAHQQILTIESELLLNESSNISYKELDAFALYIKQGTKDEDYPGWLRSPQHFCWDGWNADNSMSHGIEP